MIGGGGGMRVDVALGAGVTLEAGGWVGAGMVAVGNGENSVGDG